ncbi:hypothetical protein POM88_033050 [Heracleum sosnowskyi]|uniref:Uncharacterized protein n=1 Tax=Heracleum sosnowskyi TaxID=360622 RepID=A0AAD8I2L0_9APIA|nr:hypothetical protein POM88_033050 [Heracleum sosnowskyi]
MMMTWSLKQQQIAVDKLEFGKCGQVHMFLFCILIQAIYKEGKLGNSEAVQSVRMRDFESDTRGFISGNLTVEADSVGSSGNDMARRTASSSVEQSIWQKKQKMHPAMYEDYFVSARISRGLSFKKSQAQSCSETAYPGMQGDLDTFGRQNLRLAESLSGLWIKNFNRKRVPVGKYFQAEVPEWDEKSCKSYSKRLGSFECVRFHVSEKKIRLKLELGMAFYHWHIDKMGEEVAFSWNKVDRL